MSNDFSAQQSEEKGYLASISLSKAFNLPFSLVGKNMDQPLSPKGVHLNPSLLNPMEVRRR